MMFERGTAENSQQEWDPWKSQTDRVPDDQLKELLKNLPPAVRGGLDPLEPVNLPAELGGFRFARLMDGVDIRGEPTISLEREEGLVSLERGWVIRYLRSGSPVEYRVGRAGGVEADPESAPETPLRVFTDGTWVWPEALTRNLIERNIPPEPEFCRHIRRRLYICPRVSKRRYAALRRVLDERIRSGQEAVQRHLTLMSWLYARPSASEFEMTPWVLVEPPHEVDGFRFARTLDGQDPETVDITPERGCVADEWERDRLAEYLKRGYQIDPFPETGEYPTERDRLASGGLVPKTIRTDGTWIWEGAAHYYLLAYGIAPESDFYRHIRQNQYTLPRLTPDQVNAARQALYKREQQESEMRRRYREGFWTQPIKTEPTRVPVMPEGQAVDPRLNRLREVGGFRFPRVWDGIGPDGRPWVSPERGGRLDRFEQEWIRQYLRGGQLVQAVWGVREADAFDPKRQPLAPVMTWTDGVWIWPSSIEYYLMRYGLAPDPDFYRHIREHGYVCPQVTEEQARRAVEAQRQHDRLAQELFGLGT